MTLPLLRRACLAVAVTAAAVLGCSPNGDENTGVGGVLVVSRVDIEGGNRVVLIDGTRQLQATPRTSTGIAVPGKTVTWSSANPAIAGVSGTGLVTGVASGIVSITAVVDGVTGRIEVDVRQVPVATVQVVASVTTLEAGQTTQLQAVTLDSAGGALTGRAPAWSSSNSAVATVSPQGLVTGVGAGSAILTATSEGRSGSVTLTVTPRPASRLGFVVQPSNATAGLAVTPAIQVALQDAAGNTVTTATANVTLSFQSNPAGATLSGTLIAQTVQGIATFNNVRLNRSGQLYSLQAVATGLTAATSTTFNVVAGPPAVMAITTHPAGGSAAGAPFVPQPVVQLRDALGNDARQAGVTVTATLASGPGTLGGTTSVPTNSDGRAIFTNLAVTGAAGNYALGFASAGLTAVSSNPLVVAAGTPTQLTFTAAPPSTAIDGLPLGIPVVVQLRDATGNTVPQSGTTVTASIQSGAGALSGAQMVLTGSGGAATFPNLVITGTAGSYVLRFSASGVSPAVSNLIAVQHGAATALAMQVQPPASTTSGVVLSPQPSVRIVDQSGNTVISSSLTVTAALASGPGTLGGTLTAAAVNGVGTFTNLAVTGPAGTYTLDFSSGALTKATSNAMQIQAPSLATKLVFSTTPPATAESGVAFSPAPVVQLQDASNNAVSQAGVAVTVSRVSGNGTVMITGGSASTDASGKATFSGLTLTGPADSYVLAFLSAGLTGVTSSGIDLATLTPPAPTTIAATSAISQSATVGTAVDGPPSVRVSGAGDVPVAGVEVTFTVTAGGGTITPASPATVFTNASGIATLSNWTLGANAGSNTVMATAAGLAGSPVAFTATGTAVSATTIAANSATSQSATVGTAVAAPSVLVTGAGDVPISGVSVTFTVTSGGGTISPASPATVSTDASGIATLSNWTLGTTAGTNTVSATAVGLAGSPVAFNATGTAAAAAALEVATQPGGAEDDERFDTQPVIRVVDAYGNLVTTSAASVTAGIESGSGTLKGGTTRSATSGVASFTNLRIEGEGPHVLRFTSPGLAAAVSEPFIVDPD
jgi:hypothetical protein